MDNVSIISTRIVNRTTTISIITIIMLIIAMCVRINITKYNHHIRAGDGCFDDDCNEKTRQRLTKPVT